MILLRPLAKLMFWLSFALMMLLNALVFAAAKLVHFFGSIAGYGGAKTEKGGA